MAQTYDFARFRRALDAGNVTEALSAARCLPHVGLVEALELCLLLCDREPEKFSRAAVRWHPLLARDEGGAERLKARLVRLVRRTARD